MKADGRKTVVPLDERKKAIKKKKEYGLIERTNQMIEITLRCYFIA